MYTFLDFCNFAMHIFTNRCLSASNSLIKFRRSPYFSFRVGLCLYVSSPWWDSSQNFIWNEKHHCSSSQKIFETSLLLKELPYAWRTANISAIHKKGNKSELCNYRPVSLTCIVCKLMGKEVRDYLLDHFWAITSLQLSIQILKVL